MTTPAQVAQLVEASTPRFNAAVVLAAWCGLRRAEVCALRTTDVELDKGLVRVRKNWVELLEEPTRFEKDPKSNVGKLTLTIPPHVLPILRQHAEKFAGDEFSFVDRYGTRVRGNAVYRAFVRGEEEGWCDHHVP